MIRAKENINSSKIKIVDQHHKVLEPWAELRKTLPKAPRVLTLDHHTDTSKPFRKHIGQNFRKNNIEPSEANFLKAQQTHLNQINFEDKSSIQTAILNLNNDEHICTAIHTDIIASASVIAHNAENTDVKIYQQHKIICCSVPLKPSQTQKISYDSNIVLDSIFLQSCIAKFDTIFKLQGEPLLLEYPYILDIDLDYFNTFQSIDPKNANFFKHLILHSSLITIATEPDYVKACALDKNLSSEYLLDKFLKSFI